MAAQCALSFFPYHEARERSETALLRRHGSGGREGGERALDPGPSKSFVVPAPHRSLYQHPCRPRAKTGPPREPQDPHCSGNALKGVPADCLHHTLLLRQQAGTREPYHAGVQGRHAASRRRRRPREPRGTGLRGTRKRRGSTSAGEEEWSSARRGGTGSPARQLSYGEAAL